MTRHLNIRSPENAIDNRKAIMKTLKINKFDYLKKNKTETKKLTLTQVHTLKTLERDKGGHIMGDRLTSILF